MQIDLTLPQNKEKIEVSHLLPQNELFQGEMENLYLLSTL